MYDAGSAARLLSYFNCFQPGYMDYSNMIYLDISMVFQLFDIGYKNVYDAGSAARPLSHFSCFILVYGYRLNINYFVNSWILPMNLLLLLPPQPLLKQLLLPLLLLLLVMLLKLNTLSCCRYHC